MSSVATRQDPGPGTYHPWSCVDNRAGSRPLQERLLETQVAGIYTKGRATRDLIIIGSPKPRE